MCGIVGAIAERTITPILVEGLKRLEYRGYDSAGVAVIDTNGALDRRRRAGKVSSLEQAIAVRSWIRRKAAQRNDADSAAAAPGHRA